MTTARARWVWLLVLALALTVLNSAKPLHLDDGVYCSLASHIAQAPLDPYGFVMMGYGPPQPANQVLAPALLPYWWAAAIRLFGDRPVLWKLWLLPFAVLLVVSLHALFRRFARGLELPLTTMSVLSPTVLPSFNLMLDVPALALSLTGVALFLPAASPRGGAPWPRYARAALAGLVAGLAMETKYTGFLAPAVMLPYAVVFGRLRYGLVAAAVAALVFCGWESYLAALYGRSHFLFHLDMREQDQAAAALPDPAPLVTLLGSAAPVLALLALAGLRSPRWLLAAGGALLVVTFAEVGVGQERLVGTLRPPPELADPLGTWGIGPSYLDAMLFTALGLLVWGATAAVAWRLCGLAPRRDAGGGGRRRWPEALLLAAAGGVLFLVFGFYAAVTCVATAITLGRLGALARRDGRGALARWWRRHRTECFLVLWLALEVAGYFALSPFPAVRRVLELVVVVTLLTGRLASRTCRPGGRRRLVYALAAGNVALGLGFYAVDLCTALAARQGALTAAALLRGQGGTVWYSGPWGFPYYAEQEGMRRMAADYAYEHGRAVQVAPLRVRKGDWLVLRGPSAFIPGARPVEQVYWIGITDPLPFQTTLCYYLGPVAIRGDDGLRFQVEIWHVTGERPAETGP